MKKNGLKIAAITIVIGAGSAIWGNTNSSNTHIADNLYYDSIGWKYKTTGESIDVQLNAGKFIIKTAPSGTIDTTAVMTDRFIIDNDGNATIFGFTKLGSNAPVIKMKKLTGTTAAAEGGITAVAHNLTVDKILTVGLKVEYSNDNYVSDEYTKDLNFQVSLQWDVDTINVKNSSANSANILGKAFTLLITYEE